MKGQGPGVKGQGSAAEGRGQEITGRGFRALLAWQKAHELALAVFRRTQPLAGKHDWLVRQCSRAAVSVAANIAEGYSRESLRDYLRYLQIARGSLAEVEYYLLFMREAGLLSAHACIELESMRAETGALLIGLIRALQAKNATQQMRIGEGPAPYVALGQDDDSLGPWPSAPDPWPEAP